VWSKPKAVLCCCMGAEMVSGSVGVSWTVCCTLLICTALLLEERFTGSQPVLTGLAHLHW